jgi:hypothetical protein
MFQNERLHKLGSRVQMALEHRVDRSTYLLDDGTNMYVTAEEARAWAATLRERARKQAAVDLASARFDRWLGWLPPRMVPKRVNTEVVGDALERIGAVVVRGGSRWELAAVYIGACYYVVCEIARYTIRSLRGRKPLDEGPRFRAAVLSDTDATRRIFALPEMRRWARHIEQETGGKAWLSLRVEAAPRLNYPRGSEERMWQIAAAESHPTHLSFHRRFAIDPDSGMLFERDFSDQLRPYRVRFRDL